MNIEKTIVSVAAIIGACFIRDAAEGLAPLALIWLAFFFWVVK